MTPASRSVSLVLTVYLQQSYHGDFYRVSATQSAAHLSVLCMPVSAYMLVWGPMCVSLLSEPAWIPLSQNNNIPHHCPDCGHTTEKEAQRDEVEGRRGARTGDKQVSKALKISKLSDTLRFYLNLPGVIPTAFGLVVEMNEFLFYKKRTPQTVRVCLHKERATKTNLTPKGVNIIVKSERSQKPLTSLQFKHRRVKSLHLTCSPSSCLSLSRP